MPDARSQPELPAVGAPGRRRRDRHRRHARPEPGRRRRRVDHPRGQQRAAAAGGRPAARARRRGRHRRAPGRAHRSASGQQRLRAELLSRRSNSIAPTSPGCSRRRAPTRTRSCGRGCAWWWCASRRACSSRARSTRRCRRCGSLRPPSRSSSCRTSQECWAWAHAQAAADNASNPDAVGDALNGAPQLSLSRLVCPRLLTPNTDYIACVVPTFELGRKAGLGLPIADTELTAVERAGSRVDADRDRATQVQLPVYYSWQFRTGAGGDFESLARLLQDRVAAGTWVSEPSTSVIRVSVARPVPQTATVEVEGALDADDAAPRARCSGPIRSRRNSRRRWRRSSIEPGLQPDRSRPRPIRCSRRRFTAAGMPDAPPSRPARRTGSIS